MKSENKQASLKKHPLEKKKKIVTVKRVVQQTRFKSQPLNCKISMQRTRIW